MELSKGARRTGTVIDGRIYRPGRATTLEIFGTSALDPTPRSQGQLQAALGGRHAGDDAAALGPHPRRLALDAVRHRLADAFEREAFAGGDHLHGLAGGEPLARLDVRLAHRLAGPERLGERAADDLLLVDERGRELLGEIDLRFLEIGVGEDAAGGGAGRNDERAAPRP